MRTLLRHGWWIVSVTAWGLLAGLLAGVHLRRGESLVAGDRPGEPAFATSSLGSAIAAVSRQPPPWLAADGQLQHPTPAALDDLIRGYDPRTALEWLEQASEHQVALDESLRMRRALCLELMGDSERALRDYVALGRTAADGIVGQTALLGQARIYEATGRSAAACAVLCQVLLDQHPGQAPSDHHAFALHVLARLYAKRTGTDEGGSLLRDETVAQSPLTWSANMLVDLMQPAANPNTKPARPSPSPSVAVTRRFGNEPGQIQVSVNTDSQPLESLLRQLTDQASWHLDVARGAEESLRQRSVTCDVSSVSLAFLLDALLEPLNLVWIRDADRLRIMSQEQLGSGPLREHRRQLAERTLRTAVTQFPDHPLAAGSYLDLANLLVASDRIEEGATLYDELIRQMPRATERREARFNLAKTHWRQGHPDLAGEAFLRFVDEARGHPLEGVGYLLLGRIHIGDEQWKEAIRHLGRAASLLEDGQLKSVAVVSLASAYLLADNPQSASLVLREHRELVAEYGQRDKASLLSALARFLATPADQRQRVGRELAASVAHGDPESWFGGHGYYLVGLAYDQIGLEEYTAQLFEEAQTRMPPCSLRDRMAYHRGTLHELAGQTAPAHRVFTQLAREGKPPWNFRAQVKLAEAALDEGAVEQCFQICRRVLREPELPDEEQAAVLRLMGQAYQRQDDRYQAALCFAGMLPPESQSSQ